jgi:hypothetical protein
MAETLYSYNLTKDSFQQRLLLRRYTTVLSYGGRRPSILPISFAKRYAGLAIDSIVPTTNRNVSFKTMPFTYQQHYHHSTHNPHQQLIE